MRFTKISTLALLLSGCGSHTATVGERADAVDERTDGGAENSAPSDEPTPNGTPAGSDDSQPGPTGGSGNGSAIDRPNIDLEPGATTLPPSVPAPYFPTPETRCADTTPIERDQEEIAERLTTWLGVTSDAELENAVSNDELGTYGEVECQARRLVQKPEHREKLRTFLGAWLRIDEPEEPNDSVSTEINDQMHAEARAFLDDVANAPTPTLAKLLSGNKRRVGPELAAHYGVEFPEGDNEVVVEVPGQFGVLTLGLLNSRYGRIAQRGAWILSRFACLSVGPNPPVPQAVPLPEGSTYRASFQSVVGEVAACATCHEVIDGPGYALENFDEVGRYQTEERDLPIDASGTLLLFPSREVASFDDVVELSSVLADVEEVRTCLGAQILDHVALVPFTDVDENVAKVASLLRDEDLDLRELFVAATQAPKFWQ